MRWVNPPSERAASKSPNAPSRAVLSLPRTTTSNIRIDTALTSSSLILRTTHRMVWQPALASDVIEPDLLKTTSSRLLRRNRSRC